MLPGFRFLFAAIVLSMSVMVFGLGAAALLRAAHEEFASNPSWHATPETSFAQSEATRPVLAMLRIEPPSPEPKTLNDVPATAQVTAPVQPVEPVAIASPPVEPDKVAALTSKDPAAAETAKPEIIAKPDIQASEIKASEIKTSEIKASEIKASEIKDTEIKAVDVPAPTEAAPADTSAPVAETRIASAEQVSSPANDVVPAASEPPSAILRPEAAIAATKIATLGGPAVAIEATPPAKAAASTRKRVQARRASLRRRMARARLARPVPQQPFPFGTPPAAGG
jgi:hypothetical protein